MTMPTPPPLWSRVRASDPWWFHSTDSAEIMFTSNGGVTFLVQGQHLRMGEITLSADELAWVSAHRDWLATT